MIEPEISVSYKGVKQHIKTPEDLISACNFILQVLDDYSPMETYKENMMLTINCVRELADAFTMQLSKRIESSTIRESKKVLEKRKKEVIKFKTKLTYMLKALEYQKTKKALLNFKYNITLGFEGLGLLNGFGAVTKWGDKIDHFDPERKSIVGEL
jgi:paraquat-inducible protein B